MNALAGAITAKEASLALAIYCGNYGYLKACCKAGAPRIDLNGNVAGSVSAEEAHNANKRLAQRRAKSRQRALAKAKAAPVGEHDWRHRESAPPGPGIVAGGIRDRAMRAVLQRGPQAEDKQKTGASRQFWKAFRERDKRPAATEAKARNAGRASLADLRAAVQARRASVSA